MTTQVTQLRMRLTNRLGAAQPATWQRVAAGAILTATLTGALAAAAGASAWHVYGAVAYIAVAILALFAPNAITAQVIGGQLLAGSLLTRGDGAGAGVILVLVISVVATAELLAIAARSAKPVERDAGADLRRGARATAAAGGVCAVMLLIALLPVPAAMPGGILSIVIASGACVLLAIVLVRGRFAAHE